jgi:tetratricopeptide (TPR) repeat protein
MQILKIALCIFTISSISSAQSASEHISTGDKDYAALQAQSALTHYEAALAIEPNHYEALWKSSRTAVDLGEYNKDETQRNVLFKSAEQYARRAVTINKNDAEGLFTLARALGRTALTLGTRDRVKYATEIRAQALDCLKLNPKHPGCLHVMGAWNAEVMRLSGIARLVARNFLGGKVFGSANWADAQKYLEQAVANDPGRITHQLSLARVYRDTGNRPKARASYQAVINGKTTEFNDAHYKAEAKKELATI